MDSNLLVVVERLCFMAKIKSSFVKGNIPPRRLVKKIEHQQNCREFQNEIFEMKLLVGEPFFYSEKYKKHF